MIASLVLAACGHPQVPGQASGSAPADAVAGEVAARATNDVVVRAAGGVAYRVETVPGEHVAFRFDFPDQQIKVAMTVLRWDGAYPIRIGETDDGDGLRVLAVVDQEGPRTFWVRIDAADAVTGTLTVTRTPFTEGTRCKHDCGRLLQLPLPNDPAQDGYDISSAIARYQFGRRDLVMLIRTAGRSMAAAGHPAFQVWDLSDWKGRSPGVDTGEVRHASHKHGRDVDISLYGVLGQTPWCSHCATREVRDGRECVAGSFLPIFDSQRNAEMIGAFFASRRVRMFLDRELISALRRGAKQAVAAGAVPAKLRSLYSDGMHLQHWPNHHDHVHVRVRGDEKPANHE